MHQQARRAGRRRDSPIRRPAAASRRKKARTVGMRAFVAQPPRIALGDHAAGIGKGARSSMRQRSAIARIEASSCVTTTKVAPRSRAQVEDQPVEPGRGDRDRARPTARRGTAAAGRAPWRARCRRAWPCRRRSPPASATPRRPARPAPSFTRATAAARLRRQIGEHFQRQHDVFQQRHRAEQRAGLEHDADARCMAARAAPAPRSGDDAGRARSMRPAVGGSRPIICFISVDLPQPEPPRMTNTSPGAPANDTSRKMVRVPNRWARPPRQSPAVGHRVAAIASQPEPVEHQREHAVQHDGGDDAADHRRGRGQAHRARPDAGRQAGAAADRRHGQRRTPSP